MNDADLTSILACDGQNRSNVLRLVGVIAGWSSAVAVGDDDRASAVLVVVVTPSIGEVTLEIIVKNSKELFAPDNTRASEPKGVSKLACTDEPITVSANKPHLDQGVDVGDPRRGGRHTGATADEKGGKEKYTIDAHRSETC
jgi:hypothetical protein